MTPAEIIAALDGLTKALELIGRIAAASRQDAEWTPEQEAAWDASWERTKASPAWQVILVPEPTEPLPLTPPAE